MREIEILAPAGSYESMRAAVNAGCDAVYIGGSRFGARAFADNPQETDLLRAMDYLHLHGKRIYMTVNTLLKENELRGDFYDYIKPYYEAGLDAAIVQDVGVLKFLHQHFPDLPIHASTQMTLTSADGTGILADYGVTRFVPARELSLAEIREMRKETDLEIECFVHGALCYCYSGQCLLSSMIGGRSGNRGRCAQPCRMKYENVETGKSAYFLSPKDICTLELVPDLIEAGIDSFKIEGRMKRPEYTALCSYLYGKYTDLYLEQGREGFARFLSDHQKEFIEDKKALADLYNRGGFSEGYYTKSHGKTMMSMKRPNHYGVLVGEVNAVSGNKASVKLTEDVNAQDVLEFRNASEEALYDYTSGQSFQAGQTITANFKSGTPIRKGNFLYRTKNQSLLQNLEERFLTTDQKLPISGSFVCQSGKPFAITLRFADKQATAYGQEVQTAQNQPISEEKISAAVGKINDTGYYFTDISGKVSDDAFLPMGEIKAVRRQALLLLEEEILREYRRTVPEQADGKKVDAESVEDKKAEDKKAEDKKAEDKKAGGVLTASNRDFLNEHTLKENLPAIHLLVNNLSQWRAAAACKEAERIYLVSPQISIEECAVCIEEARMLEKEVYLSLPYIFRRQVREDYAGYMELAVDGYLIHNLEEAAYLKRRGNQKPVVLDSGLYTFNSSAKEFWQEQGIASHTVPLELCYQEIRERGIDRDTLIVYGHMPLMISAQCFHENSSSCQGCSGFQTLRDRKDKEYYVFNCCKSCYNIMYDGEALSLLQEAEAIRDLQPQCIRLDFTVESEEETVFVLKNFIDVFRYNKSNREIPNTTKGHFRRGIE